MDEKDIVTWLKSKRNKQVEYRKAWFNRQTEEKQNEMRQRAKEYSRNRYHNMIAW